MSRVVDIKALVSHIIRGDGLDKCRICLGDTSQGLVHLGDTVMMDGENPVTLSELLEIITGVQLVEEPACPSGVCVTCASAALAAQEFRMFVRTADKLWYKAITNLANLQYEDTGNQAKSICAYFSENDVTFRTATDYTDGNPKTIVNRTKTRANKTSRRPKCHRKDSVRACPDCNKVFSNPTLLHDHMKNNQKDSCLICGVVTQRGLDMKKHMFEEHKQTHALCGQCPALFPEESELKNHIENCHNKPGVFTCPDCSRSFPRQSTFENHLQMHVVRTCRTCNLQFTNRSCYREHRVHCEPDAKPDAKTVPRNRRSNLRDKGEFICNYCNKIYTTRPQLKNHILWIHMDVRPHQCQYCGKRFYTITRLAEHSVVHTRARNFSCDICGAKLVSKMAAVYHRRRHTGEKPYKCEDCSATFISSSRRLEHAKRKHNKGIRIQCMLCPASFVRKSELKNHLNKAHNNTDVKKDEQNIEWKMPQELCGGL